MGEGDWWEEADKETTGADRETTEADREATYAAE